MAAIIVAEVIEMGVVAVVVAEKVELGVVAVMVVEGSTDWHGSSHGGNRSGDSSSYTIEGAPDSSAHISKIDSDYAEADTFQPLRVPGPHLPEGAAEHPSELDLFHMFFDNSILEHLVTSTNDYADKTQRKKPNMHKRFQQHTLTSDEMMHYLGCLLLLSINSVCNYRQAWSKSHSQHLPQLHRLLSRDQFEAIGAFLHIVTEEEESSLSSHRWKKVLPLHNATKKMHRSLSTTLTVISG